MLLLGVLAIAATGLFALDGVAVNVYRLTDKSVPAQLKTIELQHEIESLSGKFSKLGLATDSKQAEQLSATIDKEIKSISEIENALHNQDQQRDAEIFSEFHGRIAQAVAKKLEDIDLYRMEATNIREILGKIEEAISSINTSIALLDTQAIASTKDAQQSGRNSNIAIKRLSDLRSDLKDILIVIGDVEAVKSRYHLTPLRERLIAVAGAINNTHDQEFETEQINTARQSLDDVIKQLVSEPNGLLSLREQVLSGKKSESEYFLLKANIAKTLEAINASLSEAIDPLEMRLSKNRKKLVSSNKFMTDAAGIMNAGNAVNNDTKSLSTNAALVMLGESDAEIGAIAANTHLANSRIRNNLDAMRQQLTATGNVALLSRIEIAMTLFNTTQAAMERVIAAKRRVLSSGAELNKIIGEVQVAEKEKNAYGEQQVALISKQQQETVSSVRDAVRSSLTIIIVVSLVLLAACIAANIAIGLSITHPLSQLFGTIEKIRIGEDLSVRVKEHGSDELGVMIKAFNNMLEQLEQRDAQLKLLKTAAEAASRTKSEFLAKMSHEIRTPMNGVLGMTELLSRTELNPKQQRFVDTVYRSGESLLTIIDDILDFSKIEAGKLALEDIEFNLRQTIEDVVTLLADGVQRKGLEFICHIEESLPHTVRGDPVRLRQILTNLLNNAIKFTERGEISVDVRCDDQGFICVSVSDTGIGIAPEAAKALFQPFRQADSSTSRKYGGTGLGLVIVKQLTEMMGGTVELTSVPGQGSTFTARVHLEWIDAGAPSIDAQIPLAGLNVLIVDDNATHRNILLQHVIEWQMNTASAANGVEAIDQLKTIKDSGKKFDIAIIDVGMPVMDGFELLRTIKSDSSLADLKIVMLTSSDTADDMRRARDLGAHVLLSKPIRTANLLAGISAAFDLQEQGPMLPPPAYLESKSPVETGHAKNVQVLLAEDNAVNQEIALAMLEDTEYQVTIAGDGSQALSLLAGKQFDVVLMDCMMPEMDGFEATRTLRLQEAEMRHTRMPVIALTANAIGGDRELCLNAGMDDYIAKPFSRKLLLETLSRWTKSIGTPQTMAQEGMENLSASPPNDDLAIIDPAALQALRALQRPGRPDVLTRIIGMFDKDGPRLLAEMNNAAWSGQAEALRHAAHTLKSTSANVGAVVLSACCKEIEQHARTANVDAAAALLSTANEEFNRALAALTLEKVTE
ncbi:Sensory box histidine kinase/response regulator [Collimonas arenae]|uniref:Sensory/regulatory protein RpfC n=1 Tax=Collimonas arenae TaxID=279058 RepID=A0A0A1FC15_9BURK|nr:Sensory box histidine kinase/response regulator [Collimonas arenae]